MKLVIADPQCMTNRQHTDTPELQISLGSSGTLYSSLPGRSGCRASLTDALSDNRDIGVHTCHNVIIIWQ
jgi:hypothetical protein